MRELEFSSCPRFPEEFLKNLRSGSLRSSSGLLADGRGTRKRRRDSALMRCCRNPESAAMDPATATACDPWTQGSLRPGQWGFVSFSFGKWDCDLDLHRQGALRLAVERETTALN